MLVADGEERVFSPGDCLARLAHQMLPRAEEGTYVAGCAPPGGQSRAATCCLLPPTRTLLIPIPGRMPASGQAAPVRNLGKLPQALAVNRR